MTGYALIVGLAIGIRLFWFIGELIHRRRFPLQQPTNLDKDSGMVWDVANGIEPIGFVLATFGFGRLPQSLIVQSIGLALLAIGITIRFTAMHTLGKYFTSIVTVRRNHEMISSGPYKYVRHPAYTGALLAHFGLGLAFGSWVSLSLSVLPFFVAAWYRIEIEEKVLLDSFGDAYSEYSSSTARIVPKIL